MLSAICFPSAFTSQSLNSPGDSSYLFPWEFIPLPLNFQAFLKAHSSQVKNQAAFFFFFCPFAFTAAQGFPCQSCIYITVTCPLTKCRALLLQGLRTEWQISASLAKYHINEQQSCSKSWGGRGDKLNRGILPEDHLSALAAAKSFSKNSWTSAVQTTTKILIKVLWSFQHCLPPY